MKEFYEKWGVYGQESEIHVKKISKVIELLREEITQIKKPTKILDAGCGDGFFVEKLRNLNMGKVYGIDISQKAVKLANKIGIIAKKADLNAVLPFNDCFFDLIYCGSVIEHLINPDNALKEFHRILKKQGTLILTTPNLACWYNRILLFVGIQPVFTEVSLIDKNLGRKKISKFFEKSNQPVGHVHIFTISSIKDLLKLHDFNIEKIIGYPLKTNKIFFSLIDNAFAFFPSFASGILIKCRKGDIK